MNERHGEQSKLSGMKSNLRKPSGSFLLRRTSICLAISFSLSGISVIAEDTAEASKKIDQLLAADWQRDGKTPDPAIDDERFVRRLYLDAIGRIPTAAEMRAFLADESPSRRNDLIDTLLDSAGYANHMFTFMADLLRIDESQPGGKFSTPAYAAYVLEALRANQPYDEFVRELIVSEGGAFGNPATGYYYRDRGMPLDHMANTVRVFLGTRVECAQCHNHPFDVWTQLDFYQMAAFSHDMTARLERRSGPFQELQRAINSEAELDSLARRERQTALVEIRRRATTNAMIERNSDLVLTLPHDYSYDDAKPKDEVTPLPLFGDMPEPGNPDDRLQHYAEWLTAPENPRFAKVIANRMWKEVMGAGLVEPLDDFTESTRASHPLLLDFLEEQMKRLKFDLKAFQRMLFNTELYQRQAHGEEVADGAKFTFTGPLMRRMSAEQIWDSLVVLINPQPEQANWRRLAENFIRYDWAEMISETVRLKSQTELRQDVEKIADIQRDHRKEIDTLREAEKQAARAGKREDASALKEQVAETRSDLPHKIHREVFAPALRKAGLDQLAPPLPHSVGSWSEMADPLLFDYSDSYYRGVALRILTEMELQFYQDEMNQAGLEDPSLRSQYTGYRKTNVATYVRAAHLPSPAPPGHFLRQLGQSDRKVIENAETGANIPQTLSLLNGPVFDQVIHPCSVLSLGLRPFDATEDRIETIYLSLLGRSPSEVEQEIVLEQQKARPDRFEEDLIFALLNSREFSLIQ